MLIDEQTDGDKSINKAIACRLCGKGVLEIGGYLSRVNAKGEVGIWECRPTCLADLSQETKIMLAIEGD